MFKLLIDTSIWLDLAKAPGLAVLEALAEMVRHKEVELIVPRIVLDEFQRNKDRVARGVQSRLTAQFNEVKQAIQQSEKNARRKKSIIEYLSDIDHKIPLVGGHGVALLDRLEKMMTSAGIVEVSDAVKVKAAERALSKLAPCHQGKNSIADAMLIETYFEQVAKGKPGERFAFITHNKNDFSDLNHKNPHPAIANGFSRVKSQYFINLSECLNKIDPQLVEEVTFEVSLNSEFRALSEINEAIDVLFDKIWYNRHKNLEYRINSGEERLVTHEQWDAYYEDKGRYPQGVTIDSVWEMAKEAGERVRKKLGKGNCGPWTDFEWGMLNGKLSALRWALGDEWDFLDT